MSDSSARYARVLSFLTRPRAPLYVIASAALLLAPCIATRMVFDDYVLAVKAGADTTVEGLPSDPLWLFTFTTGDPARNRQLMEEGVLLPWWTEPQHLNKFFRPLTSLTHVLDFRAWPNAPALMHLHSIAWYVALLFVLYRVYRTLEPEHPELVALALLFFAWDDAHGATVGWISNRNALIAVALSLPALASFHRSAQGSRAAGWLGPVWLALGLAAGEPAISVAGYLLAYAVFLDRRPLARRALALAPYVVLLFAHRVIYRVFDLGSYGSSSYHDPLQEPFEFLVTLSYNLPVLLSSELLLPLADFAFWGAHPARLPLWLIAMLGLALLWSLLSGVLKRDRFARFWCAGLCLSAIPVTASIPGERLLLVLGVGAAPLIARLVLPLADAAATAALGGRAKLLAGLAVLHGVAAPLGLPVRAAAMEPLANAIERFDRSIPREPSVRDRTVVLINAPFTVLWSYLQVRRAARAEPRPSQVLLLASASSEIRVERTGPASLRVELEHGFLRRLEETQYRADDFRGTDEVQLRGLRATIVARTEDGRPKTVQFELDEPLESPRYLLRAYRDGELVPWQPPAASTVERFEAEDFFRFVVKELGR